ncbi:unnamed protein product [Wuchereria bancrofti]|uniref:Lactamase_B domain-containing protein n=1 Tax=Wuchereria bancrofti TaxID=6293 RepID=A0A183XKF7_WUCBA|nr:unnamed protein product [Wuchereria bancrofti]
MPQPGVLINGFIAVDKFPKNAAIKYYFLTHAHSDHYGAVGNKWNNGNIYCSPVTARVLPIVTQRHKSKCGGIRSHIIHALDLNVWHYMDGFSVMLLDANHIPGSVMFLFEGDRISEGRILFTGDFRADIQLYKNVFAASVLHETSLNTIYLDTTYINCTREEFPSREASSAEMCNVLRKLFDGFKSVTIMVPKVGREQLLVDIAVEFKCKIWVDYIRFQVAEILGLSEYFTTKKEDTSIWTCTRHNERMCYIEYSDHSSPNEIRDFLSQLSFSEVIGLSVKLSQKRTEELKRLSVASFSDILIKTETNECIDEKKLPALASSVIRDRIGLASNRAFDAEILQCRTNYDQNQKLNRADDSLLKLDKEDTNRVSVETIFGADVEMKNLQDTKLSNETAAKSNEKLRRAGQEIEKNTENLLEAIDDEDDYNFNLAMKKLTRCGENLTTSICVGLNNGNAEENNSLHEFSDEINISKELKNLDSFSEKYCKAVNAVARMQIVRDVIYNTQEHVVYDISQGSDLIDIPLEWLNESGL